MVFMSHPHFQQRNHGYQPSGFGGKGSVEIPVHHQPAERPSHPQQQQHPQPPMPQPEAPRVEQPVPAAQHAAPPFHLHSQSKDAFQADQGNHAHPWPGAHHPPPHHHPHPPAPQSPQQEGGAREIPIQRVSSTYHVPPSARQQQPSPRPAGSPSPTPPSNVHNIPIRRETTAPQPSPSPQPRKEYSAPPQPATKESSPVKKEASPPSPASTPPPPQKPLTAEERAFKIIDGVMSEVQGLEEKVNGFTGVKGTKEYRYLEEMLTRSLLKLDSVETGGHDNIRQARKKAVRMIEPALDLLELKAVANAQKTPTPASTPTSAPPPPPACSQSRGGSMEPSPMETGPSGPQSPATKDSNGKSGGRVKEMVLDSEVSC